MCNTLKDIFKYIYFKFGKFKYWADEEEKLMEAFLCSRQVLRFNSVPLLSFHPATCQTSLSPRNEQNVTFQVRK